MLTLDSMFSDVLFYFDPEELYKATDKVFGKKATKLDALNLCSEYC